MSMEDPHPNDIVRFRDGEEWRVISVEMGREGDRLVIIEHAGCRVQVYSSCMELIWRQTGYGASPAEGVRDDLWTSSR